MAESKVGKDRSQETNRDPYDASRSALNGFILGQTKYDSDQLRLSVASLENAIPGGLQPSDHLKLALRYNTAATMLGQAAQVAGLHDNLGQQAELTVASERYNKLAEVLNPTRATATPSVPPASHMSGVKR